MSKKILSTLLFGLFFSSAAIAGNLYVGPSLFYEYTKAKGSVSYQAIHPQLSLGYSELSEDFYLALEVHGYPATVTLSNTKKATQTSVRISQSFGASLIPGIVLNDNLLGTVRLGVERSRFSSIATWVTGGQLGVGLQTCIAPNWDMRVEYIYTLYNHIAPFGKPYSNELGIGVMYKFA